VFLIILHLIQSCASLFKKLRSYNERSTSACNHCMYCEERTVRWGFLKMVSVDTETHRSCNRYV